MIQGVCIFYDDGPELIGNCLRSLKKVTDRILAIDGAYREFPHKNFRSQSDTMDVVKSLADTVIECKEPWKDETAKRNAYLILKSPKDYYLMLDGDEVIEGVKPTKLTEPVYRIKLETLKDTQWMPGYYNRLFRHHKGMRYHLAHNNLITKDGISLSIPDDHIKIFASLTIKHYPEKRPRTRQEQDGVFENTKEERKIILPVNQPTPATNMSATPIRLRYIGKGIYRGYDGHTEVLCRQNDLVYVSEKKYAQLIKDFPQNWALVKDLTEGI